MIALPESRLDELAARCALGLMTPRVRRRFLRIAARDPAAFEALARWEETAARMAMAVPEIAPPAAVWRAIDARLAPAAQAAPVRRGWLDWLRPALGFALVMVLAAGLVQMIGPRPMAPNLEQALPASYVGILADASGRARLLVSSQRHGRTLHLKWLSPPEVPPGMQVELWALPAEGDGFRLGILPTSTPAEVAMADTSEALLSRVTRLAVAIRPAASEASAPPVTFDLTGHCAKLW
ncbi:MAG: hypothetical protein KDG55_13180 [Rhodocyclaceae bacterium]|nr:hypothetical protein [Rhodocyclaceae bacterium]